MNDLGEEEVRLNIYEYIYIYISWDIAMDNSRMRGCKRRGRIERMRGKMAEQGRKSKNIPHGI